MTPPHHQDRDIGWAAPITTTEPLGGSQEGDATTERAQKAGSQGSGHKGSVRDGEAGSMVEAKGAVEACRDGDVHSSKTEGMATETPEVAATIKG